MAEMSLTTHSDSEAQAALADLPPLPIEGPLVAAVIGIQNARARIEIALSLLQIAPRNHQALWAEMIAAHTGLSEAMQRYSEYTEILACKGRA